MEIDNPEEILFIKTTFSKADNKKEEHQSGSIKPSEASFDKVCQMLKTLYPELPDKFWIQYRDDEDLITVASDQDMKEAMKWAQNKKGKEKSLHLFILSKQDEANILHGITNMLMKLSLKENVKDQDKSSILFVSGSFWKGVCIYETEEGNTEYPFTLTVAIVEDNTIEGIIEWTTLGGSITKFLGVVSYKNIDGQRKTVFKFREYEIVKGEDQVEVPVNYTATIDGNSIVGKLVSKDQKAKFTMQFAGVRSPKEGFIETYLQMKPKKEPNRKYNLWENNSNDRPTLQDQQKSFKRLVKNADNWYDKTKRGELQPRTEEDPSERRGSCVNCGMPLFERATEESGETQYVCSKYPHCEPQYAYVYYFIDFYFISCYHH